MTDFKFELRKYFFSKEYNNKFNEHFAVLLFPVYFSTNSFFFLFSCSHFKCLDIQFPVSNIDPREIRFRPNEDATAHLEGNKMKIEGKLLAAV